MQYLYWIMWASFVYGEKSKDIFFRLFLDSRIDWDYIWA